MGQVNCNAAQSKVRYGRVIYSKEGLNFTEGIRRHNSVNKFKSFCPWSLKV